MSSRMNHPPSRVRAEGVDEPPGDPVSQRTAHGSPERRKPAVSTACTGPARSFGKQVAESRNRL
jgi:hypothetical protein